MDAPAPVPPKVLAELKRQYEPAYNTLKKNLEDHHAQIVGVQEDLIRSQSLTISGYENQLHNQSEQLQNLNTHVRSLEDEIVELRGRLARIAENVTGVVRDNDRQPPVPPKKGSDSPLKHLEDKELPPRPVSAVSSLIDDIDDMIIQIESQPDIASSPTLTSGMQAISTPRELIEQQATALQSPLLSSYRMSSPTYSSSQGSWFNIGSPRLGPIGEDSVDMPNGSQINLPFNELQPIMTGRVRTKSPILQPPLDDPIRLLQSPLVSPGIHLLSPQVTSPSYNLSSSGYSRGRDQRYPTAPPPTPTFPTVPHRETFMDKPKYKQSPSEPPQPLKSHKHPSPQGHLVSEETDAVIRARIRLEAEKRKAAAFGPGDRVQKNKVMHSMALSPKKPPGIVSENSESRPEQTEGRFGRTDINITRVMSDGSKRTEKSKNKVRNVVRRWKSDIWKRRSLTK